MEKLLHKLGLGEWADLLPGPLHVVLVLFLGWFVAMVVRRGLRRVLRAVMARREDAEDKRRLDTLGRALKYVASLVIYGITLVAVLAELGISIAPLLATAGVAGVAIGFGAQSLVKDYFTGIVLLLENQIRVGDVVEVAGLGGSVEEVTLRYVRLRDYDGNVHFVPNGEIKAVTNRALGFAQAVVDVGIAYGEDVGKAIDALREVGAAVRADADLGPRTLADLEIAGVDRLADSAVVLRARMKVLPLEQWTVKRAMLRGVKEALEAKGIEIPFPHLKVVS
jgi:small-conductance mechanosensitive channel